MSAAEPEIADDPPARRRKRAVLGRAVAIVFALFVVALAIAWLNRETIARSQIEQALGDLGVEADYDIEAIEADRQVLRNIVIGNPRRPDLIVDRLEIRTIPRLGMPGVERVSVSGARLYGTWSDGTLSFGSLDPFLFPPDDGEDRPFTLPDLDVRLADARALIESDYGRIGISARGAGRLRDGFAGTIAAAAPDLRLPDGSCRAEDLTAYGRVTITRESPRFAGPLRFASLRCAGQGALVDGDIALSLRADSAFSTLEGGGALQLARLEAGDLRARDVTGDIGATWADALLTTRFGLRSGAIAVSGVSGTSSQIRGVARLRDGGDALEAQLTLAALGIGPGRGLDDALASAQQGAADSFAAPLISRLRRALAEQTDGSALSAEVAIARTGASWTAQIPRLSLENRGGDALLLARAIRLMGGRGPIAWSGRFETGGPGLPRITGDARQRPGGGFQARLRMARYAAEGAEATIPQFAIVQRAGGAIGFNGTLIASGAIPDGSTRGLNLPLEGSWVPGGDLVMWRGCTPVTFDSLKYGSLALQSQSLTLCPSRGQPILRSGAGGTRIAAGTDSLNLRGTLGQTHIAIRSGPVGLAWPGTLSAREMDIALGPADSAARFRLSNLTARLGGELGGTFEGAEVRLANVPLDVNEAAGRWRYVGRELLLDDGRFVLDDRQAPARFAPLVTNDARVRLADNIVTGFATLREPATGRAVTTVDLRHDLSAGAGRALLAMDALVFDDALQPDMLTRLALGVVANVRGVLDGQGRVDWGDGGLTSSGSFTSQALDFAAAFGPVQGASGTVVFTDLLGLTTAPGQTIAVKTVNPGIEVYDGTISFQLRNGEVIAIEGGQWPFLGGTLTLLPVDYNIGVEETRRFVLVIEGMDASRFIERLSLSNFSARGIFDGRLPLVFDTQGGRVEGGYLRSRPPGGNVSYLGDLTYEDLSPIANFAFDALRSLDYREMEILLDGSLTGEIVTRVRFDGVSQGEGARRNLITRKLGELPLQFNVNIRAPFYRLIGSLRSLYDPDYVPDPRDVGLVDEDGNVLTYESDGPVIEDVPGAGKGALPVAPPMSPDPPADSPSNSPADRPVLPPDTTNTAIQRRESEELP